MKYCIKDYPEIKEKVEQMSVEDLLRAVICPNIGADQEPPRNTTTVFVHPTTTECANQVAEKINCDREHRALIVSDMENGAGDAIVGAIPFPSMRAASEAGDKTLAYEMGAIAAKEAINAGYHWTFGPCVDILGNRYSPIVSLRTAGEDADTVIEYCGAYMEGLQDNGLIATLKHFPGDGYSFDDQHLTVSENPLSREEWDNSFGRVYGDLIERGAMAIMPGHIALPAYDTPDDRGLYPPASASKNLLTGLLRNKLGFEGVIVSDAAEMAGFCGYMNFHHACAAFLEAGGDCLLFVHESEEFLREMKRCIDEGRLTLEALKTRAYRMICFAQEYFEKHPVGQKVDFDRQAGEEVCRKMSAGAVKLVRDRNGLLPYKVTADTKIAHVILMNTWCEQSRGPDHLTAELEKIAAKVEVLRDPGPGYLEALAKSGDYDLIICSVIETCSWAINTARLNGPVCRNMMRGWMRYDTPVVFISYHSVAFEDTYKPVVDTLVNTYGVTKYTAPAVVDKFFR